jgi:hypothetical protein
MFTSLTEGMNGAQDIFDWASQYAKQRFKTTGALIMVGLDARACGIWGWK